MKRANWTMKKFSSMPLLKGRRSFQQESEWVLRSLMPKLPSYDQFFIALGVLQKPVDWQALDGAPVRIVFMIGGPDDKQTEYLQILSSLTQAIKDDETRKKLLKLQQPSAMIELFQTI